MKEIQIPDNTILGVNYSGFHDSAVVFLSPAGEVLYATALERVTRVKQDGRPPFELLKGLKDKDWDRISCVAVSTYESASSPAQTRSLVHPLPLEKPRGQLLSHGHEFKGFFDGLPAPKKYVCHQLSHAHSAFWPSGFEEALCFTYDGGMSNTPWFGGLYSASKKEGIQPLDLFYAGCYAKITSLYSIVTGLVGFTPNKHEGKITGLAAYGKPSKRCQEILLKLFLENPLRFESCLDWFFSYSQKEVPLLVVHQGLKKEFCKALGEISKEEIAATVQKMAEDHVIQILENAKTQGLIKSDQICLAGGLFANVKINQRVKEFGFKKVFVAPPMTDDGSAWGAALAVASQRPEFHPKPLKDVFLGHRFGESEIESVLKKYGIQYHKQSTDPKAVAKLLSEGAVVGTFQGAMEFGPRALGNRSILGQATHEEINRQLNERLCRTEFMPFAPMTRVEDIAQSYPELSGAEHTAEFMTITTPCSDWMKTKSPAVVHVDGTARPQLIRQDRHPFIHAVLTEYKNLTGLTSIINTSFNIHEEPIVCTPEDALTGFLESGLDYLIFPDLGISASYQENLVPAVQLLQKNRSQPSQKATSIQLVNESLWTRVGGLQDELEEKEKEVAQLKVEIRLLRDEEDLLRKVCEERRQAIDDKNQVILKMNDELIQLQGRPSDHAPGMVKEKAPWQNVMKSQVKKLLKI